MVKEEFTHVLDVCSDKETVKYCVQAAPSATEDDVKVGSSTQRVGLLREKLLRLTPSSKHQNTSSVHVDAQADSQPSVPTLNVEPATESENEGENEGEDERGADAEIHSKDDNKPNSELEADANSNRDVEEEVLLPDITGGNCIPVRDSQNSKYDTV